MADHWQQTLFGTAPMDVAIPSAHRAGRGAQVSANRIENVPAEGQPAGGVADQWRENIPFAQQLPNGHTERFLALAEENSTVNPSCPIEGGKLFVEDTREEHPAKCFDEFVPGRR